MYITGGGGGWIHFYSPLWSQQTPWPPRSRGASPSPSSECCSRRSAFRRRSPAWSTRARPSRCPSPSPSDGLGSPARLARSSQRSGQVRVLRPGQGRSMRSSRMKLNRDVQATQWLLLLVVVVIELGRIAAWLLRPASTWSCPYLLRSRWRLTGTKRH